MPTSDNTDKTGAAARADSGDGTFVSQDDFENPSLLELTTTPTVVDAQGIERIVGASTEVFVSAPLESSPEELAAHEKFLVKLDEAAKERQALLGDAPVEPTVAATPAPATPAAPAAPATPDAGTTPAKP